MAQQHREMMKEESNGTRNPCAGVDVSRESMGKGIKGARTWLMGGGVGWWVAL